MPILWYFTIFVDIIFLIYILGSSPWTENTICILQDAHEFLNFLLNELVDILEKESKVVAEPCENSSLKKNSNGPINVQLNGTKIEPVPTLVHKCFQVSFYPFLPICFFACASALQF